MTSDSKIAAIVAMDEARVVGFEGRLPWHLPEDMAHFKQLTSGNVVVMGRKTWDSLPTKFRPLPGRTNIVVSRRPHELSLPDGVLCSDSPQGALEKAKQVAQGRWIWIIGGGELWAQLLPCCDEVHLTRVQGSHPGDTWFPPFEDMFEHVSEVKHERCSFHVYSNKALRVG
jgi:dihydrofolate reductase